MDTATNRKSFIAGAVLTTGAAMLASTSPAAAATDPDDGFEIEVVDSVHLDRVRDLSAQGFEIKAAASAIIAGAPSYAAGNGSPPINGYYVFMQRRQT